MKFPSAKLPYYLGPGGNMRAKAERREPKDVALEDLEGDELAQMRWWAHRQKEDERRRRETHAVFDP